MLEHTFCHIPGIGRQTERQLWAAGIVDWEAALSRPTLPVSPHRCESIRLHAAEGRVRLSTGNAVYFCESLASREHWRLFPHFKSGVGYLDIETTGAQPGIDYITTICLYDGRETRYYVHGANLEDFARDIRDISLLVTYNGKSFDVPFIRHYLGVEIAIPHIDLRHVLASLGFTGGLKGCEKQLGVDRGELDGVDGYFAILLWYDFFNGGNRRALETLLAYNLLDVVNLERLMVLAYNLKVGKTPFGENLRLTLPDPPAIPFRPHAPTIERLRGKLDARPAFPSWRSPYATG